MDLVVSSYHNKDGFGFVMFFTLLHGRCKISNVFRGFFVVCVAGPDSGRVRNGNGGLDCRFADKCAFGSDRIRTVLFVLYDISVPTNSLTSFFRFG